MNPVKIGIISFAHMHAHSYAKALQSMEEVEITGIADDNQQRGKDAADKYETKYYSSVNQLLDQQMDAVIITSENIHHRSHVIAAAKAKKHILCEKPLATTVEHCQEMIDVCHHHGVKLQTAFPVRFNTPVAKAKEMIDAGLIGNILAIKGTNRGRNPGGWFVDSNLSGGGAVIDHTVHLVDIMRWFLAVEIKEVYAEGGTLFSSHPIDDAGIVTIEFANSVFATIDCSWSRLDHYPKGGDLTLEIIGEKGNLSVDAFAQNSQLFSLKHGVAKPFLGDNMNLGLIKDFIDMLHTDREPTITGEDGLKAVEVATAAYQSIRAHEVIRLEHEKEKGGA